MIRTSVFWKWLAPTGLYSPVSRTRSSFPWISRLRLVTSSIKRVLPLTENPAGVLASYDLTPEHRKALVDGDIASIEKWVGSLEERMQVWLKARLKQENISEKQASGI